MKKSLLLIIAMTFAVAITFGCYSHTHTMGGGPHTGAKEEHVQWFALWGFYPISGEIDGGQIAGTPNCRITAKFTVVDALFTFFLSPISSIGRRTIIIEK